MIIFWIIYILGAVATLCLLYYKLDKGYVVNLEGLVLAMVFSLLSWVAFFSTLMVMYGNKKVFKKK